MEVNRCAYCYLSAFHDGRTQYTNLKRLHFSLSIRDACTKKSLRLTTQQIDVQGASEIVHTRKLQFHRNDLVLYSMVFHHRCSSPLFLSLQACSTKQLKNSVKIAGSDSWSGSAPKSNSLLLMEYLSPWKFHKNLLRTYRAVSKIRELSVFHNGKKIIQIFPGPDPDSGWPPKFICDLLIQRYISGKIFMKIRSVVLAYMCLYVADK